MRIIDWSSDVCSSDLLRGTTEAAPLRVEGLVEGCHSRIEDLGAGHVVARRHPAGLAERLGEPVGLLEQLVPSRRPRVVHRLQQLDEGRETGRASSRERVGQYW